jgi:mRNA interferase MazF
MAGRLERGEVRLCAFAAHDKKRPVVVMTRNSSLDFLATATVAPISSTIRGVESEVILDEADGMKAPCAVNLHNTTTVSKNRLGKRVAQLSSARMAELCAALRYSFGCDFNDESTSVLH